MANPAGESNAEFLRLDFDRRLMLQFRCLTVKAKHRIFVIRHHSRLRSIPLPASARAAFNPRITALRQIVEAGNSATSAISRTASTSSGGIKTQMRSNGSPPLGLVRVNLPSRPFSAGGSFSKCGSNSGGWKKGGAGGAGILRACCCGAVCGDIFGAVG
jgi:hypothetical protein